MLILPQITFNPSTGPSFAVTPYTGNGSTQSIVTRQNLAAGGLVWLKETSGTDNHDLLDTVRGINRPLESNTMSQEQNPSQMLLAFLNNGFTLGSDGATNTNGDSYIAFSWLKQAGYMDIVTYTGDGNSGGGTRSIPHSLGVSADLIMIKARDNSSGVGIAWCVRHSSMASNTYMELNSTGAASTGFGITSNSSNLIIQDNTTLDISGVRYVAYLFAEKAGKSKFGSYTGTGSSPLTVTGLGFTPKLVMVKRTDSTGDWLMGRNNTTRLYANTTDASGSFGISMSEGQFSIDSAGSEEARFNVNGANYTYSVWG